jgi:glutamyl-Q tRNA(Asp) synthetase
MSTTKKTIGRFAPSPTGDLHFGSLVSAVASYLQARSDGGKWLIRVEDIDPPREVDGSAASIIHDLSMIGLNSDEKILFQSERSRFYQLACEQLLSHGLAYWCGCSRKDLPDSGVYPGTCRNGLPTGKQARSIRIKVDTKIIQFTDALQGYQEENLSQSVGDFVIKRADGLYAYQLAVVVDDFFQNITQVVRGADLLDSTARQIHLQNCLGFPLPEYAHIPLVLGPDGKKLSKSLDSPSLGDQERANTLRRALLFLGQDAPQGELDSIWDWAKKNWSMDKVTHQPRKMSEF